MHIYCKQEPHGTLFTRKWWFAHVRQPKRPEYRSNFNVFGQSFDVLSGIWCEFDVMCLLTCSFACFAKCKSCLYRHSMQQVPVVCSYSIVVATKLPYASCSIFYVWLQDINFWNYKEQKGRVPRLHVHDMTMLLSHATNWKIRNSTEHCIVCIMITFATFLSALDLTSAQIANT